MTINEKVNGAFSPRYQFTCGHVVVAGQVLRPAQCSAVQCSGAGGAAALGESRERSNVFLWTSTSLNNDTSV